MSEENVHHNGDVDGEEEEVALDDADEIIEYNDDQQENGYIVEAMEDLEAGGEDEGEYVEGVERDDAQLVFQQHKGSVFCVNIASSGVLAVTGGEDDKAFVWQLDSGKVVLECTGHKDSVTCAAFSHDSALVATGDMSGLIKVWQLSDSAEIWSFEVADLEWMQWHQAAHVLLAGCADGNTWMWKVPSGDCKTMAGHGAGATVGRILPDGKRACVGYDDGSVKVFDLKNASPLHSFTGFNAHTGPVTCMDCHHDNSLVLTGSTDGTARLYNVTTGKLISTFTAGKLENGEDDSFEAVGFSPVLNFAATGTLNGDVCIWDLASHSQRLSCKHKAGIVRLRWDASQPLVYTSTLDGSVQKWDTRTGQMVGQWLGHEQEVLDMDMTRNGQIIVSASSDGTVRVFANNQ